jgi:hypothetical protein
MSKIVTGKLNPNTNEISCLFQFPSDSGVRAKWFKVLREICGTMPAKKFWPSFGAILF